MDPVAKVYAALEAEAWGEARHHTAPPKRFRASEASECRRKIWHRLRGDRPAPRTGKSKMYGICGDSDHDLTRQLMEHYGVNVGNVRFDEDSGEQTEELHLTKIVVHNDQAFTITARADGTLPDFEDDPVLEIKGMGFYYYKFLNEAFAKGGIEAVQKRLMDKHLSYVYQAHVTMYLVGRKRCYLLVKDRSSGTLGLHNEETGERSGIFIEWDEGIWLDILDRFAYVTRKLAEDDAPIPEYTAGSNECSWCDFRYRCHDMLKRIQKNETPHIVYPGPQMEEYSDVEGE